MWCVAEFRKKFIEESLKEERTKVDMLQGGRTHQRTRKTTKMAT